MVVLGLFGFEGGWRLESDGDGDAAKCGEAVGGVGPEEVFTGEGAEEEGAVFWEGLSDELDVLREEGLSVERQGLDGLHVVSYCWAMPTINFGTSRLVGWQQLSDSAQTGNDHGPVAINQNTGMMVAAWHYGTTNRTVACRVFQMSGSGIEATSGILTVGVPGTSIFGGGEDCMKPWVCELADGSFVVIFVRRNLGGTDARIEATRVVRTNGVWGVQNASTGIGQLIDGSVTYGAGDVMPRTCWVTGNKFYLAYVHETANSAGTRAYTCRSALFSWTDFGSPPVSLATRNYTSIPINDGGGFTIASGGYVVPTCCVNRRGEIILAYEERSGVSPNFTSSIRVKRLTGAAHPNPLTEAEAVVEQVGPNNTQALRRPMLSCPHPEYVHSVGPYTNSTNGQVYLAYGQEESVTASSVSRLRELRFDAGAATSFNAVTWPANTGANATADGVTKPTVVYGTNLKAGIGVANNDVGGTGGRRLMVCHSDGVAEDLTLPGAPYPDRPDAKFLMIDGQPHCVLLVESADAGSSDTDKFVYLFKIS